jgi:hypothetical protein
VVAYGARQHGNGVADSLPSGSGNLDVQLKSRWSPLAYPLHKLELGQREVNGKYETGFVSK